MLIVAPLRLCIESGNGQQIPALCKVPGQGALCDAASIAGQRLAYCRKAAGIAGPGQAIGKEWDPFQVLPAYVARRGALTGLLARHRAGAWPEAKRSAMADSIRRFAAPTSHWAETGSVRFRHSQNPACQLRSQCGQYCLYPSRSRPRPKLEALVERPKEFR